MKRSLVTIEYATYVTRNVTGLYVSRKKRSRNETETKTAVFLGRSRFWNGETVSYEMIRFRQRF